MRSSCVTTPVLLCLWILALALLAKEGESMGNEKKVPLPKFRKVNLGKEPKNNQERESKRKQQELVDELRENLESSGSSRSDRGASLQRKSIKRDPAGGITRFDSFFKNVRVRGAKVIEREFEGRLVTLPSKTDLNFELDSVFRGKQKAAISGARLQTRSQSKTKLIRQEKRIRGVIFESQEEVDAEGDLFLEELETPEAVLERVKREFSQYQITEESAEFLLSPTSDEDLQLVYSIRFNAEIPPKDGMRGDVKEVRRLIDAETGATVLQWDALKSIVQKLGTGPGGNVRTQRLLYGLDKENLEVDNRGGTCFYDTRKVTTFQGFFPFDRNEPFSFPCFNQALDDDNTGSFSPLNDAHFHATKIVEIFADPRIYGEPLGTINPKMQPLKVVVNDIGVLQGAAALWDRGRVRVEPDSANNLAAVVLDIMAHEVGHGITEGFSNLEYVGEAGAINEAFSDLTAKFVQFIVTGKVDWTIGKTISRTGTPLRFMLNPTSDRMSVAHVRDFARAGVPHLASGILNRPFALMGQNFALGAWDVMDAVYVANREFWTSTTNFEEAAEGILGAMEELRSGKHFAVDYSHLHDDVAVNAFADVGLRCTRATTWDCVKTF